MTPEAARVASTWRYPEPYSVYDSTKETYAIFLNPLFRYHTICEPGGSLLGFCCFGADARVPGGRYRGQEPEILDIGLGMCPERTGRGLGRSFLAAILEFATARYAPEIFRATIAEFNLRSSRTFERHGFAPVEHFDLPDAGLAFKIWERPAHY